MAGAFTAVDLSRLPFPSAVETLNFETILAAMVANLQARDPSFSALVESDPAFKILEVAAFRELLIRQRVNEAIKAVTLANASGTDLDQIAANYNVERLLVTPADNTTIPPTPAVYETDDSLRRRVQLSFEGFSTAGPEGAYIFHALGADGRVLDASVKAPRFSKADIAPEIMATLPENSIVLQVEDDAGLADPLPGDVAVAVQQRGGDGTAETEVINAVAATLSAEDVRPLTDNVHVRSATVIEYEVVAELKFYPGPDRAVVLQAAQAALDVYTERQHRMGRSVTRSGIFAALHQEGVRNVILTQPATDVAVPWDSTAYCTDTNLTDGGTDD